ncbi:hypothetical protein ACVDG8_015160 [Mesorhizobium sp. ORM8.1]
MIKPFDFLGRFTETVKRPVSCFDAIPDGKPLHTFPGIALGGDDSA